jgi:DNA polymerase-3 subunit alpha
VYQHEAMRASLESTYGILVYQEQVMQIAKDMCGFTGGQADTLRKAIGKKKIEVMAKMRADFIEGAITTSGADRAMVEQFWTSLEDFAAYCFNKSHAACYGLIAYQTAYLKAHYPAAFMAALLTSDHDNSERIAIEVTECQRVGIEVLPPDVNESFKEFGVVKDTGKIRYGLAGIKNIGNGPIEAIIAAREDGGPFVSVEDFAKRVNASECNKKVWESLIKAGAMDRFGDRGKLLANLDILAGYAAKAQKNALSGQIDLFGSLGAEEDLPAIRLEEPTEVLSNPEKLGWEKELLGLYLSHHPLDDYAKYLIDKTTYLAAITQQMEGRDVTVGGIITTVRKIVTKKGDSMAFVGLEDKSGIAEVVVFPRAYEKTPDLWQPDVVLLIRGKVSYRDRDGKTGTELKIMAEKGLSINYDKANTYVPKNEVPEEDIPVMATMPEEVTIRLHSVRDDVLLMRIRDLLQHHEGDAEVFIVIDGDNPKKIRLPFRVKPTLAFMEKLEELVGEAAIEPAA